MNSRKEMKLYGCGSCVPFLRAGCIGPQSEQAGKADGCAGCPNQKLCASGEAKKADPGTRSL